MHKWADLQRALLPGGHSVWCCKGCIGIIKDKENKDATYEEIRIKVEDAAEPLPEVTGGESTVRANDMEALRAELKAEPEAKANARGAGKGRAVRASETSEASEAERHEGAPKYSCDRCSLL